MSGFNDLRQIREFVQIAESGSISRAARVLGVAQPTLSRRLAALEGEVGSALVRRDTHTMSLTEAGRTLLTDARELLALADRMGGRLRRERETLTGHLRLVSVVDVGQWVVSRVLSRFQGKHPQVTAELHLINRPMKFVKEGFDCGILVGAPTDRSVVARRIALLPRRVLASPELLKRFGEPERPEELGRLPWLGFLQPHFFTRDRLDLKRGEETCRLKLAPSMLLDTVTAVREAVIEGAGFTVLPEWMSRRDVEEGRLVELVPEWRTTGAELYLAHAAQGEPAQRVARLLAFLEEELPREIERVELPERPQA
jgi:DNA-binding transcriptional LysR family regulator